MRLIFLLRYDIMIYKKKVLAFFDRSEFVEMFSMRNEINEPAKNNLPNDMIDWDEISEFIIDTCNFDREQNFTKILHEKTTADRLI